MRFGTRTILAFTAVYAGYLLWLVSAEPKLEGMRLVLLPHPSMITEAVVLLGIVCFAFLVARHAIRMKLYDDWRRGLLQLVLSLMALFLFSLPLVMRMLILWLDDFRLV